MYSSNYKTAKDFISGNSLINCKTHKHFIKETYDEVVQKNNQTNMEIKWDKIEYGNSSDPNVWGPAFWYTLHNSAVKYPVKASPLCANRMKGFLMGIPVMVPCDKCADHACAHIEDNWERLDEVVSGREELFKFFHSFHNKVNKRYNKPEMSLEDAYKLYTSKVNITKFTYRNT